MSGPVSSDDPDYPAIKAHTSPMDGRSGRFCASPHARSGIVKQIQQQVRFARVRFGRYDLIDVVAVLLGSILSGEPTRLSLYERLALWASPFMALFGRNQFPHRSTLSRFLATRDQPTVEA